MHAGIIYNPSRLSIPRAVTVSLILAVAVWVFVFKASRRMPDFEVYWRAGARAAQAEPLYRTDDGPYQFKYFPAFAVLFMPIGALPLPVAKAVWFGISMAAFIALLWLSVKALPDQRRRTWVLITVALVVLGKYYAEDLVLGQINLYLTLIATGAIVAFNRGRETLGGSLIALAVAVKPYAMILLPWLAARGRLRAITAAAIGVALALLLPAVIYGIDGTISLHREWWRTVTDTTADTLTHSDNVSIASMTTKWFGFGRRATSVAIATTGAVLAVAAMVFLYRRHVRQPDGLEIGFLVLLTPLISPQGWDYVLLVSTPAIVYLANYFDALPRVLWPVTIAALLVIGLTLYDVIGRELLYAAMNISLITVAFLVVIVSLGVLRLRRAV